MFKTDRYWWLALVGISLTNASYAHAESKVAQNVKLPTSNHLICANNSICEELLIKKPDEQIFFEKHNHSISINGEDNTITLEYNQDISTKRVESILNIPIHKMTILINVEMLTSNQFFHIENVSNVAVQCDFDKNLCIATFNDLDGDSQGSVTTELSIKKAMTLNDLTKIKSENLYPRIQIKKLVADIKINAILRPILLDILGLPQHYNSWDASLTMSYDHGKNQDSMQLDLYNPQLGNVSAIYTFAHDKKSIQWVRDDRKHWVMTPQLYGEKMSINFDPQNIINQLLESSEINYGIDDLNSMRENYQLYAKQQELMLSSPAEILYWQNISRLLENNQQRVSLLVTPNKSLDSYQFFKIIINKIVGCHQALTSDNINVCIERILGQTSDDAVSVQLN